MPAAVRSLPRFVFNALAALSLVFCVAACAMWVRNCWVRDTFLWRADNLSSPGADPYFYWTERAVVSARGGVRVEWQRVELRMHSGVSMPPGFSHESSELAGSYPLLRRTPRGTWANWAWLGFQVVLASERSTTTRAYENSVTAPFWLVGATTAAATAALWRWRPRGRRVAAPGHCPACGYDLRATPGRCPECGTVPSGPSRPVPVKQT